MVRLASWTLGDGADSSYRSRCQPTWRDLPIVKGCRACDVRDSCAGLGARTRPILPCGSSAERRKPRLLGRGSGSDLDVDRVITKVVAGTRNHLRSCPPMRDHRTTSEAAGATVLNASRAAQAGRFSAGIVFAPEAAKLAEPWSPIARKHGVVSLPFPISLTAMGRCGPRGGPSDVSGPRAKSGHSIRAPTADIGRVV